MSQRRLHERYSVDLAVQVESPRERRFLRATNVSLGGMFLSYSAAQEVDGTARNGGEDAGSVGDGSHAIYSYGDELTLRFRLPALKEVTVVTATARWTKPDGVGVQFASLRAIDVWAMNQLFRAHSR